MEIKTQLTVIACLFNHVVINNTNYIVTPNYKRLIIAMYENTGCIVTFLI